MTQIKARVLPICWRSKGTLGDSFMQNSDDLLRLARICMEHAFKTSGASAGIRLIDLGKECLVSAGALEASPKFEVPPLPLPVERRPAVRSRRKAPASGGRRG